MKKFAAIICAVLLFSTAAVSVNVAYADEPNAAGDFTVTGNESDYSYDNINHVLTISGSGTITISTPNNSESNPTTDRIVVDSPNGANITLSGVYIDRKSSGGAAFDITGGGPVTVTLDGDNFLQSGSGCAGLQNNEFSLTINGSGKLTAYGGSDAAGIGGGNYQNGSNITIKSGTIIAISNYDQHNDDTHSGGGAGIGGGNGGSGSNITIYDGKIRAEGHQGAGIGGGYNGRGSGITINGGEINAKSNAGGAGIGGGYFGSGIDITINGGNIRAEGPSSYSAGIGGGTSGDATNIIITGCEKIYAEGGLSGGPGIGGYNVTGIKISGGSDIEAKGGENGPGAGIGGSVSSISVTGIEISGGTIKAKSSYGAGIGGGSQKTEIKITGGTITEATGSSAGIGSSSSSGNTTITIEGGTIIKATGTNGAGIGVSSNGNTTITISGGVITEATGGKAGIGGNNGNVSISGGNVTATGTNNGSGIKGTTVEIGGETTIVNATGNGTGDGITGSTIKINNGDVTTNGNTGIGGSDITISGGNVTATGTGGAGIGGTGSTVNINGTNNSPCPWVETNKIERTNKDNYNNCIVFDDTDKKIYSDDYTADGIVYGNVALTEAHTLEGNTLGVSGGAALTTNGNLTLGTGSILYLEEGATLNTYKDIKGDGVILHEDKSEYDSSTGLCKICGSTGNHEWATPDNDPTTWSSDATHHWHNCNGTKDCSINHYLVDPCNLLNVHGENQGYAEHVYNETPDGTDADGNSYYDCTVCKYRRTVTAPVVTEPTEQPPTETSVPTETTVPDETTVPSEASIPPVSYIPSGTTTASIGTEGYPNDYSGEDISAEAGYYEDNNDGINVIPPIILIVITAASAFVLYRREKK